MAFGQTLHQAVGNPLTSRNDRSHRFGDFGNAGNIGKPPIKKINGSVKIATIISKPCQHRRAVNRGK
jgi:hypothetical protein